LARRTKEEAQATRERLLDTAEAMFLQRGVARTSLNDIASAAGLTRGAVYWHFDDKAALYNALMDRFSARCVPLLEALHQAPVNDPAMILRRMALIPIELMLTDTQIRRLFTIAMHRIEFSDDLAAIWQRHVSRGAEYIDMLQQQLEALQATPQGCTLRLPVRLAALGLFALVHGLLTHASLDAAGFAALQDAPALIDAYLTGVGCPPPAPPAN
jgi:TetR/AcrR family acrAB operon transcriptional repressor